MRRFGSAQHFFTVRGRGFDDIQWRGILEAVRRIVERAGEAGIKASLESDALQFTLTPKDAGEPLVVWRKGEPGIPRSIKTEGMFDPVVQSVLAAIKKIAPMVFEMTCPDGRDYRRMFAKAEQDWAKAENIDREDTTKEHAFQEYVSRRPWRNHQTGNDVKFSSLPREEQKDIRHKWEIEHGAEFDRAKKQRADAEKTPDEKKDTTPAPKQARMSTRTSKPITEDSIRRAAIRVAAKTNDPSLKRAILEILRGDPESTKKASTEDDKAACEDGKLSRHTEDKGVDVGDWLKEQGHDEAAAKWEKHEGDVGKAAALVFPEIHALARQVIMSLVKKEPVSKVASGTPQLRFTAAGKLAEKWIQDAIKEPGRVRKYLGVPEGEAIPQGKLNEAIEKVKGTGNKSLLSALLLAKRLKGMKD